MIDRAHRQILEPTPLTQTRKLTRVNINRMMRSLVVELADLSTYTSHFDVRIDRKRTLTGIVGAKDYCLLQ